jgi:hypothetical protein
MSRLGVKSAIARMVVDPRWREEYFQNPGGAVEAAGFDITKAELGAILIKPECVSAPHVTMENFEQLWQASEQRNFARMTKENLDRANFGKEPSPLCFGG